MKSHRDGVREREGESGVIDHDCYGAPLENLILKEKEDRIED